MQEGFSRCELLHKRSRHPNGRVNDQKGRCHMSEKANASTLQEDRFRKVISKLHVSSEFYEPLERYQPREHFYNRARGILPRSWRLMQEAFWTHALPLDSSAPVQGWKIHISATPKNAEKILTLAVPVLVKHQTAFKFASDYFILSLLNSKSCSRGSSGKFMTVYPRNEEQFKILLSDLDGVLKGQEGPYILSDKRYKDNKVLYYRYGGIRSIKRFDASGDPTPMLLAPNFEEVPDQRSPQFVLPAWVQDPFPSEEEESSGGLNGGRYVVNGVMGHSNTGGVYSALDQHTGKQVVIKEARPHTNMNLSGNDAIDQLRKEHRLLQVLSGSGISPEAIDYFTEWEHEFLVQERIEGSSLRGYAAQKSKIIRTHITLPEVQDWFKSLRVLSRNIVEVIHQLHERQVVFGDLSPNNIMLISADTLQVKLIDFEGACEVGIDEPVNLYTPGFASQDRKGRDGIDFADDHFALGSTLLSLMMPLTVVTGIKPDAIRVFTREVQQDFGIPEAFVNIILSLTGQSETVYSLPEIIEMLSDEAMQIGEMNILHNADLISDEVLEDRMQRILTYTESVADFGRKDRLFPGGPHLNNPLSVDHGALGVTYALHTLKGEVPEQVMQWILRQDIHAGYVPGLYGGLSGMAWTLAELGYVQQGKKVLKHAELHPLLYKSMDLQNGAAGYGLTCLYFWQKTGEDLYLQEARIVAEVLSETAIETDKGLAWGNKGYHHIGYAHGSSGIALFLLYLYSATGDQSHLEMGKKALDFDLNHARDTEEGTLGFPDNTQNLNTLFPYLMHGSAGVGTVLLRYHHLTGDARYLDLIGKIKGAVAHKYALFPSLFAGLTGLGNYLLDCHQFLQDDSYLPLAHRAASGMLLFGIEKEEGLAFPGDYLHRISTDYATGSAGMALFLHRLKNHTGNFNFLLDELLFSNHHLHTPPVGATF